MLVHVSMKAVRVVCLPNCWLSPLSVDQIHPQLVSNVFALHYGQATHQHPRGIVLSIPALRQPDSLTTHDDIITTRDTSTCQPGPPRLRRCSTWCRYLASFHSSSTFFFDFFCSCSISFAASAPLVGAQQRP